MFEYEQTINNLERFKNLSDGHRISVLKTILIGDDFRYWFYQVGNTRNTQFNSAMLHRIMEALAAPDVLRAVISFIRNSGEEFDRTSSCIAYVIADTAIDLANEDNADLKARYEAGEITSEVARDYKARGERYSEIVGGLINVLKEINELEIKVLSEKSGLPKDLILSTFFVVPGRKFVPPYRINSFMDKILQGIYRYIGSVGYNGGRNTVNWHPYFKYLFGSNYTASVALAILLEGVPRIVSYSDSDYYGDVKDVWDDLTKYALYELNNAPDNVRNHMIELYVKKLTNAGGNIQPRINLLEVPTHFSNLVGTIERHSGDICKLFMRPDSAVIRESTKLSDKYPSVVMAPDVDTMKPVLPESSTEEDDGDE